MLFRSDACELRELTGRGARSSYRRRPRRRRLLSSPAATCYPKRRKGREPPIRGGAAGEGNHRAPGRWSCERDAEDRSWQRREPAGSSGGGGGGLAQSTGRTLARSGAALGSDRTRQNISVTSGPPEFSSTFKRPKNLTRPKSFRQRREGARRKIFSGDLDSVGGSEEN